MIGLVQSITCKEKVTDYKAILGDSTGIPILIDLLRLESP